MTELSPARKPIHAVILDKDNCEFNRLNVFGNLSRFCRKLQEEFGLRADDIQDYIRNADPEIRFHDGHRLLSGLVNTLDFELQISSRKMSLLQYEWRQRTKHDTIYYPGVLALLRAWRDAGTLVVTRTDCEALPLIRSLYDLGLNATQYQRPEEVLSFYDGISCYQGLLPEETGSEREAYIQHYADAYTIPRSFIDSVLNSENFMIHQGAHKPNPAHLQTMLERFDIDPERALYIGDSPKDGIEAQQLGIDFAWAAYGTNLSDGLIAFCQRVASPSYPYGRLAAEELFETLAIPRAVSVEDSKLLLPQLSTYYDFCCHRRKDEGLVPAHLG